MPARFDSLADVMRHALALASRGLGRVEPNPQVGAVVVDDKLRALGEGWHRQFGGPHAEVHALAAAGPMARGATLVCTLEPCAHHGQTPPCAEAVISAGIRRVILGAVDPAPHTNGSGIARLKNAGIEVQTGLLERECRRLIGPFSILVTRHRPYVHAKWAMTLDGRIASHSGHSQWISNERSRAVVHQLRGRMDGILVGIGTVIADNPRLTARPPGPRNATRIVLDSRGRTPVDSQLTDDSDQFPTLIATTRLAPSSWIDAMQSRGVEIVQLAADSHPERVDIKALLQELGRRRMTNLLVEGGSCVMGSFFDADLIDEYHVFIAPKVVGGSQAHAVMQGQGLDAIPTRACESESQSLDGDIYLRAWVRGPD